MSINLQKFWLTDLTVFYTSVDLAIIALFTQTDNQTNILYIAIHIWRLTVLSDIRSELRNKRRRCWGGVYFVENSVFCTSAFLNDILQRRATLWKVFWPDDCLDRSCRHSASRGKCSSTERECDAVMIWQAYVLMMVLSLTADEDAAVWKGPVLVFVLFVVTLLATAGFVAGSTIGHVTGSCRQTGF